MKNEIRNILKNWLQSKDDIIFTDDIAINEITDEIVEPLMKFIECMYKDGWYVKKGTDYALPFNEQYSEFLKYKKLNIPTKCKTCIYIEESDKCWAVKGRCNPSNRDCDYIKNPIKDSTNKTK